MIPTEHVKFVQDLFGQAGGWHVTVQSTEEEQREGLLMTLLLLDKNKYA